MGGTAAELKAYFIAFKAMFSTGRNATFFGGTAGKNCDFLILGRKRNIYFGGTASGRETQTNRTINFSVGKLNNKNFTQELYRTHLILFRTVRNPKRYPYDYD